MNEDKIIAPWKRKAFDEMMLDMNETSVLKQNAALDGIHQAAQHLALDEGEALLAKRNPDRPVWKRRTMTEREIREWCDGFVMGYIARVKIHDEEKGKEY